MKKLLFKQRSDTPHWVGDGFPVRSIFTYRDIAKHVSPFLLMDYAGPTEFSPTDQKRGVGAHPHRGFETVTLVYNGEVEHRDSAGGGGKIGPGDVQWMTAASGLVHEEFHGADFAKRGGAFETVQLWVNLPGKDKMAKPRYQGIRRENIPAHTLPHNAGTLRVIAGGYADANGPARTFSPVNLWDLHVNAGAEVELRLPAGHTTCLFVRKGKIAAGGETIAAAELGVFEAEGEVLRFRAEEDTDLLFLGGEPIAEPIAGYGPFVMNTFAEIQQAFRDFEAGAMGSLGAIEGSE